MTRICERAALPAIIIAIALSLGLSACGKSQPHDPPNPGLDASNAVRWHLPKRLDEISGLALSADGRLFAHDDELGVIYRIDWQQGRLTKAFSLGDPPPRADFEGIAIAGGNFYLVTSDGVLYRTTEGDDGAHVPYERFVTGTGARCEIEGLAYDARRAVLLLGCKAPRAAALKGRVAVFAWSPERRTIDAPASFSIPEKSLAGPLDAAHFNTSGIEMSRDGLHLYLLAGRQRALAEVDLDGGVVAVTRLPAKQHRQPEGLAIGPDGELIVADEAGGGRATLAVYRRP
jgi:uncharacterized protein YjiK